MNKFFATFACAFFLCAGSSFAGKSDSSPSWYIKPKQNNSQNLYGVAMGYTLEEATRYALADAASRLMVSVSSESNLVREENQNSTNEELRQNVRQNIEKIDFVNFKVSESEKFGENFFVEVQINRQDFINDQQEKLAMAEKKLGDLDKNSRGKNPINRRNALLKIIDLGKQIELSSRILAGSGADINLEEKLSRIANFQSQLAKLSDGIEFFFEINSPANIAKLIRSKLNKEKIKISPNRDPSDKNQIVIRIKTESTTNQIYGAYIAKLEVDFENLAEGKVIASNSLEVTGSSAIGEKESLAAAIKSLEEKIESDGILKVIGIIN